MKFNIFRYKIVQSTNKTAIRKINSGYENGIVVSEKQSNGKGRYGREWISKKGNLFTSIFFKINKNFNLKKVTSLNCNIIKACLEEFIKKKIIVKKPNDMLINKKKLCGILRETFIFKSEIFMIVGIGINIASSPKVNGYKTTHLNEHLMKKVSKYKLFNSVKKIYEKKLKLFNKCI